MESKLKAMYKTVNKEGLFPKGWRVGLSMPVALKLRSYERLIDLLETMPDPSSFPFSSARWTMVQEEHRLFNIWPWGRGCIDDVSGVLVVVCPRKIREVRHFFGPYLVDLDTAIARVNGEETFNAEGIIPAVLRQMGVEADVELKKVTTGDPDEAFVRLGDSKKGSW